MESWTFPQALQAAKNKDRYFNGKTEEDLLFWAVEKGNSSYFSWLEHRADKQEKLSRLNGDGATLIHVAARRGDADMVYWLWLQNVPADTKDGYGYTPLAYAASGGWSNVIYRLPPSIDVNSQDNYGQTPLMKATIANSSVTVQKLLEGGASKDITDNGGSKAIDFASEESIRKLLR